MNQTYTPGILPLPGMRIPLPFLPQGPWWDSLRDVLGLWKQWVMTGLILAVYLVLTFAVDIPGCPRYKRSK